MKSKLKLKMELLIPLSVFALGIEILEMKIDKFYKYTQIPIRFVVYQVLFRHRGCVHKS